MDIEPVVRVPAHELVLDQLRKAIHLGTFAPGDRLPPERELAKRLNVSRVTVREAVGILQGQGYIEAKRGQSGGLIVLDQQETLSRLKQRISDDWPRFENILDFRKANECAVAYLAASRRTPEDLNDLNAAILQMQPDADGEDFARSLARFRRADSSFHLALADAARNPLLKNAVEEGRTAMFLPSDNLSYEVIFGSSVTAHNEILAAIDAADPDAAADAMREHIETTRHELREILSR